ncbi:unnamed protein product [Arctia plantaginis]|uniref:Heat shock protein 70 n=1 Tax=Arctia plantaginis TaxID=874455 RepID=A0A8S0ZWW0_ARCPL|nr:unnamed protein product [Arctia plantaginis]
MLSEAERYKEEDEKQRQRVSARNQLESYMFSVKQALDEAGEKLSQQDKDTGRNACDETMRWLDNNTLADQEEYEHKLKELQRVCSPLMSKMHGASNGTPNGHSGGMPDGMQGSGGMPGGMNNGMPNGFPGGMPSYGRTPGGMPGYGGMPGGMPGFGGMPGGMNGGMPGYGGYQRNDGPTVEEVY